MTRVIACLVVVVACTKSRTSEPAPGSATAPPAPVAIVDAAPPQTVDARSIEVPNDPPVGAEAIADPTPVTKDEHDDPAKALSDQLGGSQATAQHRRSLVVVKSKTALDTSSMPAGKMAFEFVKRGQASVKQCFDELRAKDAGAKGTLTLRFAVDATGAVVDAQVEGFHADVVACVKRAMPAWRFAAPDKRARYELVLDLVIG